VTVAPMTSGAHSALISLDHPSVPGHAYRTMATVVAAEPFDVAGKLPSRKGQLERPGPSMSYYVNVPPGTEALAVNPTTAAFTADPIGRESGPPAAVSRASKSRVSGRSPFASTTTGLDLAWMTDRVRWRRAAPYTLTVSAVARIEAPSTLPCHSRRSISR